MSLKPIKEGYSALIIHSAAGNSGVVKVGKFLGSVLNSAPGENDYWEVDHLLKFLYIIDDSPASSHRFCREANLMRIDGEEADNEQFEEEEIQEGDVVTIGVVK